MTEENIRLKAHYNHAIKDAELRGKYHYLINYFLKTFKKERRAKSHRRKILFTKQYYKFSINWSVKIKIKVKVYGRRINQ